MSYDYKIQRESLFTEYGSDVLIRVRDRVKYLLQVAGAFRVEEALATVTGDSWTSIAAIDYLAEKGEIVCLRDECWGQYRVFSTPKVHNL